MKNIYGKEDTLHENYIIGAVLHGKYDFPALPPERIIPNEMIPFSEALTEKQPRKKAVHFFIDDDKFERIWNRPDQYIECLQNFQAVCMPDFSSYLDMPMACQIWNRYRSRVIGSYLVSHGVKVIPTAGWSDEESYSWCFDGLPQYSAIAVSTNGCHYKDTRPYYINGMLEMERRLRPAVILCVGTPIDVPGLHTEIVYYNSYGKQMGDRIRASESATGHDKPRANRGAVNDHIRATAAATEAAALSAESGASGFIFHPIDSST